MPINNVKNTQSLLADIEDWMNNPKFQPQEQNKWFFGEGLSYYTQLCEVVKVLTYLQENFKIVIANEKSLEQAYNEVKDLPSQFTVLSNKVDDLTNTVSDLPTRVQELETKVTKLISDVSSQLTRIETLEGSVATNTNDIATIKTKNQEQDTLIDSNTNKITTLEGKDFLTNVRLENSNSVTFQGGEKVDGVQTYSAQVVGSVPVNLGENVAYASNNDTPIVTSISNENTNNDTTNTIERIKQISTIDNGQLNTQNIIVEKYDKQYFNINNDKISLNNNEILSNSILLDGTNTSYNNVTNINNFHTGIGMFYGIQNLPKGNIVTVVLSCSSDSSAKHQIQIAIDLYGNFYFRKTINNDVGKWYELIVDNLLSNNNKVALSANQGRILNETKQDKLIFSPTWFVVDGVNVSLKESIFDSYLTKTDASSTYVSKTDASSTYVSKTDAVGYDDILTKTEASGEYETKQHANATYETKANASTTYETKAHASTTYPTKTEMTNAINSAIGTAINSTY